MTGGLRDSTTSAAGTSARRAVLSRLGGGALGGALALLVVGAGAQGPKPGSRRRKTKGKSRDRQRGSGPAARQVTTAAVDAFLDLEGIEVIHACAHKNSGDLRRVDGGEACLASEEALQWSTGGSTEELVAEIAALRQRLDTAVADLRAAMLAGDDRLETADANLLAAMRAADNQLQAQLGEQRQQFNSLAAQVNQNSAQLAQTTPLLNRLVNQIDDIRVCLPDCNIA